MSLKDKIMNVVIKHPRLVTLGIGLAITFVIGTAIGMVDHNNLAYANHGNSGGNGNGNGNALG
jgi:hypothetical protein